MEPKISVIMPVYNSANFLKESMESILQQTYSDFEFILINDGSQDNSVDIIRSYRDNRIRLINNEKNSGLATVRNIGLQEAKGKYIAWLDSDDISLPTRLERQVNVMESNPEIGLCGTWVQTIEAVPQVWKYPIPSDILRCRMLLDDPFATSSVMIRRSVLKENQFHLESAEDYDLWERLLHSCEATNIPEILTLYRFHENQTSTSPTGIQIQKICVKKVYQRQLGYLQLSPTETEMEIHQKLGRWEFESSSEYIRDVEAWLLKIAAQNEILKVYPHSALLKVLGERWELSCKQCLKLGFWVYRTCWNSALSEPFKDDWKTRVKFLMKAIR